MLNGSLLLAMESEHTKEKDATESFSPSNGPGMATTSTTEWTFVASPDLNASYPERDDICTQSPSRARVPWRREDLEARMDAKNRELVAARHVPLIVEEAIGVRLYTGRRHPGAPTCRAPASPCCALNRRCSLVRMRGRAHVRKVQLLVAQPERRPLPAR